MFDKPINPRGYVVYDFNTKLLLGKFFHLRDIRNFAIQNNISPDNILVYRLFYLDVIDENIKLLDLNEYAYTHTEIRFLGGIYTEIKSWSWTPQDVCFLDDWAFETWIRDEKNKIILFLHKVSQFIRLFL